jgi:ATP-dependent Clp protease ATP-binding subunit ClpC
MKRAMARGLVEPELAILKRDAEELAGQERVAVTTAHLLAAIAARPSATQELLRERKLTQDAILGHARGLVDHLPDALRQVTERARALAQRTQDGSTGAPHLLVALLHERRFAGFQAVASAGVDPSRLRSVALNLAQGLVTRRRVLARPTETRATPAAARASAPPAHPRPGGVVIPLVPVAPKKPPAREPNNGSVSPAPQPTHQPPVQNAQRTLAATSPRARARSSSSPLEARAAGQSYELDPKCFPTLTSLGKNLTLAAACGELDRVVGREDEIESVLDVLAKRQGNCPVLVGAPGVGKTSVVRGLVQRIAQGVTTSQLDARIVIELPVAEIVAGTGVRGARATRLGTLKKELTTGAGRVVVFFDELHQLFAGDGMDEIQAELRLALGKGELFCIGATSTANYAKYVETDPTLARRLVPIEVEEPGRADAFLILESVAEKLSAHHAVAYGPEVLAVAVNWSMQYLPGRALPDKAIALLDLGGARARRRQQNELTVEVLAEVVAEAADVPLERLLETDAQRMLELERILGERVVGHQSELVRMARILRRNTAGLGSKRPLGTFLLLGPTGVGKTETAKAIAEVLFGSEHALTRFDLSEFSEPHSIARLIGSPPGYVGHEAGGQLTEAVRRRPYQVILLDEVEKAHRDVLMAFLSVFDEGHLTDGRGRRVDFSQTVILLTSNLGAEASGAVRRRRAGFGNETEPMQEELERAVLGAARATLAPELYNRIDEVLVLAPLDRSQVKEIARRLLTRLGRHLLAQRGVTLEWDAELLDHLLDQGGYEPSLGARPMKRTLARLVEAPLAEWILLGQAELGRKVRLTLKHGQLEVHPLG